MHYEIFCPQFTLARTTSFLNKLNSYSFELYSASNENNEEI